MKQTINKRLTLWLLTLALAVVALPALTAPAQAAEKTPVDVVFGSETVKGEQENPHGTTLVHCENVTYTLETPKTGAPYYQAYTTWATGDIRIADTVDGKEVRKIRSGFAKELTGKVTLGKNIRSLDYSVFSGGKLREVTIPEDSNLYRICQYAFRACPNLVRVGVGNTDKLPASVTDIDYYAFYESPAIQSIDLTETKVKSIGDCTFTDCTALTSVKLPDGLTSIGHSAFKGCTALEALDVPASVQFIGMDTFSYSGITDLKLRCGAVSASGMGIARSLLAMPDGANDGAKVYLPRPSTDADYEKAMQFIYGNGQHTNCGANAKVKVYWMDGTAPVTEPSARSNSVVTLSGQDKDGNTIPFSYNYNGDANGLGAVIHLNGRQKDATLKLTLNGSGTTNNTNAVIFTRVRAYDSRHQGNIDSKAFSGKELTELLLRQQAVNYNGSASSSMSRELNLALSSSDKLGLYYYIPTLVNKGSTSQPMNAKTLPPVLVVYTPTDGKDEGVGLETNFGSSNKWFCGDDKNADFSKTGLPGAYPLYADGFEACFGTESDALTKGKPAYFNGGQNAITYQWKRVNKDGTSVLETIGAQNYEYSKADENKNGIAYATFNCYENVLPRGLQYCIGGLSGSYLQNLYKSSGVGTYYFQPTITVKVNDTVSKSVTGPIQSVTFYDKLTYGTPRVTVDYTDSGTGNATGPLTATGAPNDTIKLYTLKKNTINALAAPKTNLLGLDGKSYDGTIVYDWYYYKQKSSGSGNGPSTHFKDAGPTLPLNQLAKEEPGRYTLYCTISVRNGRGDTVLKSWTDTSGYYCWVDVLSENADYPEYMPTFENCPKAVYFSTIRQAVRIIPPVGSRLWVQGHKGQLELYTVNSKHENRGGTLVFSTSVTDIANTDPDAYVRVGNLEQPMRFPDYKARWCYYKYTLTNKSDSSKVYVSYSPTFALQPAAHSLPSLVSDGATPLPTEVKVTGQPYSKYWLPDDGSVTLTAELETKNYPLTYIDPGLTNIFRWYSVDAGKDLTKNANFTQSVRIDSADIDAEGNLLLKGALSATFKRGSGSSDDYFDTTLPLTGNPTVSAVNREFYLRSPSDLKTYAGTQDKRINTVTIHPTTVSVAAPKVSVTGGRMVPVWNSDTGKYEWGAAPTGEFAENEYRLFSERFDGKAEGQYSNIPASPAEVRITASTTTSGATIQWRVTVSDGTGNVTTTDLMPGTASVTYDSATESNGYAAYEDKATAAWTSGSNSTLTVDIPTGAKAIKLTVQPMAVKTNSDQIVGLTYGDVYEVYTNRAAKATTPTISNVYNGAPTYKVSREQLAKAEDTFVFASPNIWVGTGGRGDTTYRWYLSRVKDERSVDIGTAIPLSEEMTVSGAERDYSVLSLTAELLRQHCAQSGGSYNDTLYIYAYAQNYDPSATQVQYAEKLMKVCEVVVADFYAMSPVTITPGYNGTDTVDIYYGQKAPEKMFSITIPLPADKTRYSVRLRGEAKSTDGTMAEDQSTGSVAILRDDSPATGTTYSGYEQRGNYYVYIPKLYYNDVPHMTVNIDEGKGTATFTVNQRYFPNLTLTSIYVSGIGTYQSVNMDFEFYWSVQGEYFGSANTATGGDRTETTGTKYTVHRRQYAMSAPTLSFYTGTEASYSGTTEKPIPDAADTAFWGGETPAATLPGFRQHSSGYSDTEGLRPVTVTVGASEAPWVLVRMEYWKEQNEEWRNLNNSSMVSVTGETREYKDGSTTYTLVKPGSTVEMLTGPGAYFSGGKDPRFLRIAAYPMGVNAFSDTQDTLTGIDRITPAKQIFVVQPLKGEVVDAATPACSDDSSFEDFTFIARDSSMTKHTFGANGLWSVGDGGKLSYQWMFYNSKTAEYENIADQTDPTLTVTKAQAKAWSEHNGKTYTSLQLVVTNTNPTVTGNRYVTTTYSTTVYYQDNAVTPRVSIASSGKTAFNLGEQGGTLTGTVSNPAGELTNPSYAWGCRVTHAVENDGTKYDAPADTAFCSLSKDDVAGADTKTLKLYAINDGSDYKIGDRWYSMSSGSRCLWDSYKEVTIEYRLSVTENYTSGSNTTYATGTSNTISVTIKRPVQVTALSVTENDGMYVDHSHCILRDDNPLTFTAPEAAGRSYVWARSWEAAAGSGNYSLVENWTEPTLVLTKADYWSSSPYILCVMTDTYTDPNSKKTLELTTESERILVHYIGENAAKPLFTAGNQTVVADPGATGKSFDGTATSPDLGYITYKWEMVDRVTGEKTALSNTNAKLNLDPYTTEIGAWYFICTATNTRTSDGKSASDSWSYELYIRGVTLKAELPEVDAVAGESSEVKLTATAFGLHGGNFAWTNTGATEWTLKDVQDGNWYSNFVTLTATAVAAPTAGSSGALNTTVTFSGTSWDGSAVKTASVDLKANVKDFMVAGDPIELTMGEAVPAGTKLTHKGAAPDTWQVVDDDGLTAVGVTVDANGTLSGTPTVPGPYRLTVQATNGTTTATSIVTVYVKISEREGLGEYGTLTVGENTSLDVRENHSGSGWNWDACTGVLTLDNYNGGRLYASGFGTAPLYIRLRGSSTVTASNQIAIYGASDKGTVLCGDGNLTVNGTGGVVKYALDVRGSGKIKVNGTGADCKGIDGSLTVGKKGDVEISGSGERCKGIDGALTVNGGTLNITVTGARSCGISADHNSITIPAGTVTVTAKGAGSSGMDAAKCSNFQVSGGTLTVKAEGDSSYNSTVYAVYAPQTTIHVSGGGTFDITGKQVNRGIYWALLDVDGGTLNINLTRTGDDESVYGVEYYNTTHFVKNGGKLNINIEADAGSYVVGIKDKALEVDETSTATIKVKSDGDVCAAVLERLKCDGTINLTAESGKETATAGDGVNLTVEGKGTLTATAKGSEYAQPFGEVTFNGTDGAKPLTVNTHATVTAKIGTAYLNNSTVNTQGNVNITMEVASVPGAEARGLRASLNVGHTAGFITLRTVAGTTLANALAGEVNYDPANFAVTGNPKGKDFVTYTAISEDTLLISNTSGGAVTLYQNTELNTGDDRLTFTAKGGAAPYTWALTGTLPAGMSPPETTGAQVKITGKPTAAGSSTFTLTATDKNNKKASATVTVTVKAADLVFAGYSTTGIFRDNTLYLPLSSDWATNTHGDEKLYIKSVSGDINKKLTSAESTGVLRCYAGYSDYINFWIRDTDPSPKVGNTGTITVTLRKDMDTVIATYTYNYEFVKDNPRYLTVGSRKFPAMLENASGTGSKGSWSWDCAKSTLTLDNYEGTNGNSLVWADRKFSGLTVIYKGNVVADDVRYINHENLPDLTYKPSDDNATLTMKQQSSSSKDYGVGADITFEGGNVTLYPRRRLVDPKKSTKVCVKDVKQFIISDVWLYNDETLGADVVVPQYATDYWLYKAADDRVMSCGTVAPTPEFSITGPDKVTKTGSVVLKAEFAPWFTESEKYDQTNKPLGKAFKLHYAWPPEYTDQDVDSVSVTAGTMPIGGSKTVSCEVWTEFNGLTSGRVSDTHTVTVVADGVKVSGQVTSYNGKNGFTVTLYEAGTKTVKHTATISGTGTSGQVTQDFNLDTVAAGEYDLVVTKAAHLPYTVKNVKVEGTDLDLTTMTGKAFSTITLLCGDINNDGSINPTDINVIYQANNYYKSASEAATPIADLNGDGSINPDDINIIYQAANYYKSVNDCTFNY